jgi:hypothetical protein
LEAPHLEAEAALPARPFYSRDAVHLRPPSIDPGVTSFIWALLLGLFVWGGLLAIGVSQGTAFVLALLSFAAIFLFVRLRGGDDPVR